MKKILITGGAGFIGSSLLEKLIETDKYRVVVLDSLLTGKISNLPAIPSDRWVFIRGDVNNYRDVSKVMLKYHFDYIFHYAAVVGVKRTLQHPLDVLKDIEGIKNVLTLAKDTGVKRVFFSSSSEVYGEPVELPQNELTTPLNSRLPYAVVKNIGEAFMKSYYQEYGVNYTIFRFFNTYGPRQSEDFVVSKFIRQSLNHQDITIYGKGNQTRTFCYIDDNLDTTINILEKDLGVNETINIGNDQEISILELAEIIIKSCKSKSKIIHLPPLPEGDMSRRQPDITLMKKYLGRGLTPLNTGLNNLLNSFAFVNS